MKKKQWLHKKWLVPLLLALLSFQMLMGTAVAAQTIRIELSFPEEGKVGDEFTAEAHLIGEDSSPIPGVEVVFYMPAEFASVVGEIEIGRTETDEQGIASLAYTPRSWGETTVIVRFAGDSQNEATEATAVVLIEPGPQLHTETAGINVPGVGVWVLASALGAVWGVFFIVVVLLGLIARKGEERLPYPGEWKY